MDKLNDAIKIENLSYSIANKKLLKQLNLTIPKAKFSAIIGANGACKSTLLNIMGRLNKLQTGNISYAGFNLGDGSDENLAKILAILPQENHITSRITVEELLIFGRYPYHKGRPSSQDLNVVASKLNEFDLTDLRSRYLDQLSGGQRQRALLAMIFAQDTPFILLDEPLNNLDIFHKLNLLKLIRHNVTQQAKTVVMVMHDINQAIAYADNIIALKDGELLFMGEPNTVITPENIFNLFKVKVSIIEHQNRKIIVTDVVED